MPPSSGVAPRMARVPSCRSLQRHDSLRTCGLRWDELLALRRMEVDLNGSTINVHRSLAQLAGGRLVVGPPKSAAGCWLTAIGRRTGSSDGPQDLLCTCSATWRPTSSAQARIWSQFR